MQKIQMLKPVVNHEEHDKQADLTTEDLFTFKQAEQPKKKDNLQTNPQFSKPKD